MNVRYIPIAGKNDQALPLTTQDVSNFLLADWLPNLPFPVAPSFFGWPAHILVQSTSDKVDYLTIHPAICQTERQWKSMVSWMLGVAGARKVLSELGYRWVAPASAFYPEAIEPISIRWPNNFPRTSLTVTDDPEITSRLRPDYLALKPGGEGGAYSLCAAEAKGTKRAILSSSHFACPGNWKSQVCNIQLAINGIVTAIPRHIVIATRVNPNAKRDKTRQLSIRAWNSEDRDLSKMQDAQGIVPIVLAHLYGFYRNIGDTGIASELAQSCSRIASSSKKLGSDEDVNLERDGRLFFESPREERILGQEFPVTIKLSDELMRLTKKLIVANGVEEAVSAVIDADSELDEWNSRERSPQERGKRLSFGVEIESG